MRGRSGVRRSEEKGAAFAVRRGPQRAPAGGRAGGATSEAKRSPVAEAAANPQRRRSRRRRHHCLLALRRCRGCWATEVASTAKGAEQVHRDRPRRRWPDASSEQVPATERGGQRHQKRAGVTAGIKRRQPSSREGAGRPVAASSSASSQAKEQRRKAAAGAREGRQRSSVGGGVRHQKKKRRSRATSALPA